MSSLIPSLNEVLAAGEKATTVDTVMIAKLTDMVGDLAVNLVIAAVILAATVFAARWVSGVTRRTLSRVRGFRHDPTVLSFAVQVVRVLVYVIGLIAVLQRLGVQTTSIIAVLGAASLAVGLALQGTLSNVAAGVVLLILRPYKVGDVIDIGGAVGTVQRLDLFTTQMSNPNNHKIVVPNAPRAVIAGVAEAHDKILADPPPWTGVTGLLDSAVQITLHAWAASGDWWQTQADLMQAGKEAIDAAGIEIPFPHQVEVPAKGTSFARIVTTATTESEED
jgi:small conductance mechanosensitive channel